MRLISGMEGLTSLAATVVRNAPSLLLSLSSLGPDGKQQPVVVWLGKLERKILEQLSVSEEWKHAHDAARAEGKGRGGRHPAWVQLGSATLPCCCLLLHEHRYSHQQASCTSLVALAEPSCCLRQLPVWCSITLDSL